MDERHLQHTAKVLGGLLEPSEDTSAFLQPSDQALDNVSVPVRFPVEFNRPIVSIFVALRRDNRSDAEFQQVTVDPLGAVTFVACHRNWPGKRLVIVVNQLGVRAFKQRDQSGGLVRFARCEMEVQRVARRIAEDVKFCRKTAAGTA